MTLTHTDVRRILEILDQAQHLDTLEVRIGDFLLRAAKPGSRLGPLAHEPADVPPTLPSAAIPATPAKKPAPQADKAEAESVPAGLVAIRAPMVGSFYRRPKPDEPPFVEEGQRVAAGDPLALLEAMKLFNTVSAPIAGRIAQIAVEDGVLVQRDTVLILIEPEPQA